MGTESHKITIFGKIKRKGNMSQMLTYPGFSVVFIQTFSVHHTKEFILPKGALDRKDKDLRPMPSGFPSYGWSVTSRTRSSSCRTAVR